MKNTVMPKKSKPTTPTFHDHMSQWFQKQQNQHKRKRKLAKAEEDDGNSSGERLVSMYSPRYNDWQFTTSNNIADLENRGYRLAETYQPQVNVSPQFGGRIPTATPRGVSPTPTRSSVQPTSTSTPWATTTAIPGYATNTPEPTSTNPEFNPMLEGSVAWYAGKGTDQNAIRQPLPTLGNFSEDYQYTPNTPTSTALPTATLAPNIVVDGKSVIRNSIQNPELPEKVDYKDALAFSQNARTNVGNMFANYGGSIVDAYGQNTNAGWDPNYGPASIFPIQYLENVPPRANTLAELLALNTAYGKKSSTTPTKNPVIFSPDEMAQIVAATEYAKTIAQQDFIDTQQDLSVAYSDFNRAITSGAGQDDVNRLYSNVLNTYDKLRTTQDNYNQANKVLEMFNSGENPYALSVQYNDAPNGSIIPSATAKAAAQATAWAPINADATEVAKNPALISIWKDTYPDELTRGGENLWYQVNENYDKLNVLNSPNLTQTAAPTATSTSTATSTPTATMTPTATSTLTSQDRRATRQALSPADRTATATAIAPSLTAFAQTMQPTWAARRTATAQAQQSTIPTAQTTPTAYRMPVTSAFLNRPESSYSTGFVPQPTPLSQTNPQLQQAINDSAPWGQRLQNLGQQVWEGLQNFFTPPRAQGAPRTAQPMSQPNGAMQAVQQQQPRPQPRPQVQPAAQQQAKTVTSQLQNPNIARWSQPNGAMQAVQQQQPAAQQAPPKVSMPQPNGAMQAVQQQQQPKPQPAPTVKPKAPAGSAGGAKLARQKTLRKDISVASGLTAHATQPVKESPMPKQKTAYGLYTRRKREKYIQKQMGVMNPIQSMNNPMPFPPARKHAATRPVLMSHEQSVTPNPVYDMSTPSPQQFIQKRLQPKYGTPLHSDKYKKGQ